MSYFNENEEFIKHNSPNYQCPFCGQKKVVMHTKNWLEAESVFKEIFQMDPPKEAHTFQMICKSSSFDLQK
jgi:hypothetical protein